MVKNDSDDLFFHIVLISVYTKIIYCAYLLSYFSHSSVYSSSRLIISRIDCSFIYPFIYNVPCNKNEYSFNLCISITLTLYSGLPHSRTHFRRMCIFSSSSDVLTTKSVLESSAPVLFNSGQPHFFEFGLRNSHRKYLSVLYY